MAGPHSVLGLALWERRRSLWGWVAGAFAAGLAVTSFYPIVRDSEAIAELLERFPPLLMALFGVDPETITSGTGFVQAQLYTLIAPLLITTFAISAGASATAGEEERGSADLVLAHPVGRARFVLESFAALALGSAAIALALAAALSAGDVVVDLGVPASVIAGLSVGVWLLALVFGALALAVGAWSGSRALGLGVASAAALVGYFVSGLAPLVEPLRGLDRLSPFHWYLGRGPGGAGLQARHAVLAAAVVLLVALATLAFRQRDLGTRLSLTAWLRRRFDVEGSAPGARPGRLDGLLTSVYGKTLWERRGSILWWALALWGITAATIAFWPTLRDSAPQFEQMLELAPPELFAAFGIEDPEVLMTPAGFVTSRVYGGIGLILVIVFAASVGSATVAGECERRTMDVLLATPISRRRVVLESFAALATLVLLLVGGLVPVVWIGDALLALELEPVAIVAANAGLAATALVFGALALAVGCATGRPSLARGVVAAVAIGGFLLNVLAASVPALDALRVLSPLYWLLGGGPPLARGFSPWTLASLAVAAALVAVAAIRFERRDLV